MASSSSYRHAATASASVPQARLSHLLLLFALCLLLVAIPAQAAQKSILLLSSGSAKVYQRVSSSIGASLQRLCSSADRPGCAEYRILESTLDGDDTETSTDATRWNLVVTIGVKAANHANKRFPAAARLYTLIPKSSTADLGLESAAGSASAIYLDQPITRQLNLIKLAMAGDIRIGALLGPTTDHLRSLVEMASSSLNLTTHIESVANDDEIGPALRRTLDESDILLALPDPLIYNQKTIFNILLSSYHNRIPVVGFSASYVRAGAMLAVYSNPDDIGMQIAEVVESYLAGAEKLPRPQFPKYFSIEINRSVSRSLGINLPDERQLTKSLKSLEGR